MLRAFMCCALFVVASTLVAQEKSYSICVAPYSAGDLPEKCLGGQLCGKGKLQLRVDKGPLIDWPAKGSRLLEKLPAERDHRITVYVGSKARQTFRLRNADFGTPKLCLFINDLYRTVQLWPRARCPWCSCE